jgi:outer membrane immunogenic protein
MALRHFARSLAGFVLIVSAGVAQTAQAQNWDGSGLIRFGVFLQGANVDYQITQTPNAAASFRESASPDGLGVGLSAGYDLRLGSIVIGGEIDGAFDDGRSKASVSLSDQYGVDYYATARGRLGFMVHPAFMIYATGGYGMLGAEYKLNGLGATPTATGTTAKKTATLGGFTYGGGVEYDMSWAIVFAEYLHTDYDSWTFRSFNGNAISVDPSSDLFRLGFKFKIGQDYSHDVYRRYEPLK